MKKPQITQISQIPITHTFYDTGGQRILTTRPDGTVIYTPFPDYEREVASGGAVTERVTYRLAGQVVAVRSAGAGRERMVGD